MCYLELSKGNMLLQGEEACILEMKKTANVVAARSSKLNRNFGLRRNMPFYLMFLPVMVYLLVFRIFPILYSLMLSAVNYKPMKGVFGSKFVGFKYYAQFFKSVFFWRLIRNTLAINLLQLTIGFVIPIILALLLNEVTHAKYKKLVQSVTYLPNLISSVVVVSIMVQILSPNGLVNSFLHFIGKEDTVYFFTEPNYFWSIFTIMTIWQGAGRSAIIYLAAITGIDSELYEAAALDGAGRWQQVFKITLPCLTPTIVILFLMAVGRILDVGYDSILLMYNESIYSTADVIGTYIYRAGVLDGNYSYTSAVGFFQSVMGLLLVIGANKLSRKLTESSLW